MQRNGRENHELKGPKCMADYFAPELCLADFHMRSYDDENIQSETDFDVL